MVAANSGRGTELRSRMNPKPCLRYQAIDGVIIYQRLWAKGSLTSWKGPQARVAHAGP